jgi:beta-glucanase (GH16 family)
MTSTSASRIRGVALRIASLVALALAAALVSGGTPARAPAVTEASGLSAAAYRDACGPLLAKPGGGTWRCTFVDNFSGSRLNTAKWAPMTTALTGVKSHECRVGRSTNVSVGRGTLRLTVRQELREFWCATPGGGYLTQFTGGNIASKDRFSQTYGRFEIRASFPAATIPGLHSALWLWPDKQSYGGNWRSGEIDIAEYRTFHPGYVVPAIHYVSDQPDPNATTWNCAVYRPDLMHVYVLEWTSQTLTIKYDGRTCLVDNWQPSAPMHKPAPFNRPFFMILTQSLGMGGNLFAEGATPLPATTRVDWVKVWS